MVFFNVPGVSGIQSLRSVRLRSRELERGPEGKASWGEAERELSGEGARGGEWSEEMILDCVRSL